MIRRALPLGVGLLVLASPFAGATVSRYSDELWVDGRLAVGLSSPTGRCEVRADATTPVPFQVSGWWGFPFFAVNAQGAVALGTTAAANLDVAAWDSAGAVGMELRGGGTALDTAPWQMLFGYASQPSYRHGLKSVHTGSVSGNSLNFYLWTPAAGGASAAPTVSPLSLVSHSTGVSVHVRPVSQVPDVELVVSDGATYAQGTVRRASEGTHSSAALKTGIVRLGRAAEDDALAETMALKHASYRYKGSRRMRRGLIFEEAPSDLRAPGGSIVVDERVVNAELALKALLRRLEAVEQSSKEGEK